MHPAFSVIFFTVVSGAGYGLLFATSVVLLLDPGLISRNEALLALALGAVCASAGLVSSMLHLGQPLRAWRAFSQWRSSWLSREGVAALASFVPMVALAALLWRSANDRNDNLLRMIGAVLATLATLTVYCTAGIYTSLKTIRAWRNRYVLPGYLLLGLLSGGAWLWLLDALFVPAPARGLQLELCASTLLLALFAAGLKRAYWRFIDAPGSTPSVESATGLGRFGQVHAIEAPHTEQNYLINEMGFQLARKHAQRLRGIALLLIGIMPALLAGIALVSLHVLPTATALRIACASAAVLSTTAGAFVERWLFFAEAKHVVMLYYGAQSA